MKGFREVTTNCHSLADRFHGCRQSFIGIRKLFKSKARNFNYNIIQSWFKGRWSFFRYVIWNFIEGVANCKSSSNFGNWKSSCFTGKRRRAGNSWIHFNYDDAAIFGVHCKLNVTAASINTNCANNCYSKIAQLLKFSISQCH